MTLILLAYGKLHGRSPVASGRASTRWEGDRPAVLSSVGLRRNSALDLFSRAAPDARINGRLF
jgi:hypothetical protein